MSGRLCLITDRRRLSPGAAPTEALDRLVRLASAAAAAGVDYIQLRERDLDARTLADLVKRCTAAVKNAARVLVNDRIDVALAAGAHGVHLRGDSIQLLTARRLLPLPFVIGRSVRSAAEAIEQLPAGPDYLIYGTVFPTASKAQLQRIGGVEGLAHTCAAVAVPVLAIGGVTVENAGVVIEAGAGGIAAIGAFIPPPDVPLERHVGDTVDRFRAAFDTQRALS